MIYPDFHFHFVQCLASQENIFFPEDHIVSGITCCHDKDEYNKTVSILKGISNDSKENAGMIGKVGKTGICFGIHPQKPSLENLAFLESLLKNQEICGIGECGFDYFEEKFKNQKAEQVKAFEGCLELAVSYDKPLIIHDRKALDELFYYSSELKKLPFVIFHGFAFSEIEAKSLLSKGINGYFSFGKALLRGNKKSISCVQNLPLQKLLFETDAPYMIMKDEKYTPFFHIQKVYEISASLLNMSLEELCLHEEKMMDFLFF